MLLGDIIKEYREQHQMSLQDFAELVHTSRSYIHMLEKNYNPATGKPISPSIETLKSIAHAMNIDIEDLLKQLNADQNIYLDELEYHKQFSNGYLNSMMENCGKRLKECRIKNNLSTDYIAKKVNVPVNKIKRWEDGITSDIDNRVLKILSDLYDVDPGWLMGLDVPMELENNPTSSNNLSDVRMASYNGIDTEGLDEDDIAEINLFIEKFIKPRKEKNK